jgi:hypothetical protein
MARQDADQHILDVRDMVWKITEKSLQNSLGLLFHAAAVDL